MSSLYRSEDQRYTEAACDLSEVTGNCVSYLFREYIQKGYPPREISHVIISAVFDIELRAVVGDDLEPWNGIIDPNTSQRVEAYMQRYTLEPQVQRKPIEEQATIETPAVQATPQREKSARSFLCTPLFHSVERK